MACAGAPACISQLAQVQRDYVFDWLLTAIYADTALKDILVFKGGNCFRKAYFPNTRFSSDLDFGKDGVLDESMVVSELNKACAAAQLRCRTYPDPPSK
jgi:predicted nucleotidyltransferase component of viral defense system